MAGLIIGKAGESINNLRKEQTQTNPEVTADLRLLVHSSQAGVIIGRGGGKIREFRENSRLKTIKVHQFLCPESTERVVQLVGDPVRIIPCLKSIAELIISYPPRSNRIHYDAKKYNKVLAPQYGGWSKNTSNDNENTRRRDYDSYNQRFPNPSPDCFNNKVVSAFCAVWSDILSAKINAHSLANCSSNHNCASVVDSQGNGPNVGPAGDSTVASGMLQCFDDVKESIIVNRITTAKVSVSDKMIGAIMGKGGTRINQVRRECGAEIKIGKMNHVDGDDRIITITGTPDQIQNAQFLLQVCVKKYGHL